MAVFAGFRPFLTKGSTINGAQNIFFKDNAKGFHYLPEVDRSSTYSASNTASIGNSIFSVVDKTSTVNVSSVELMKNGTFSTTADWSYLLGTDFSITGSALVYTGATGQSRAHGTLTTPTVAGKSYLVEFDITITTSPISGDIRLRTGTGGTLSTSVAFTSGGKFSTILVASDSHTTLGIFGYSGAFLINNISVKELIGKPAIQSSISFRPLLGSSPKSRFNLINSSEDLTTWATAGATTIYNKVMETTAVDMHVARAVAPEIYFNTDYYFTVEVKAAEKSYAVIGAWWTGGVAAGGIIFNLNTGTSVGDWSRSPGNISATFLSSENMGDGWWRVKVYINNITNASPAHPIVGLTNSTTSVVNEFYAGTAGNGIFVRKAHAGLTPFTIYQKTELNRLITTQEGQKSFPFIRLDLSDDKLTTVLPEAITGDVIIAGKKGSIVEPISYSANTTFELGPTTYTGGTPNILTVLGDIVGYSLVNRPTTRVEQNQMLDLYKARGAKGRLVEGPELFKLNGTWIGDFTLAEANSLYYLSGPTAAATFNNSTGTVTVTQDANLYYGYTGILLNNERQLTAGKLYKATIKISSVTVAGWGSVGVWANYGDGSTVGYFPLTVTAVPITKSFAFISSGSTQEQLRLYVGGPSGTAVYDTVSIKEIRPEEDW